MADIADIIKGVAQGTQPAGDGVVVTGATMLFAATIIKLAALCFGRAKLQPENVCDRG